MEGWPAWLQVLTLAGVAGTGVTILLLPALIASRRKHSDMLMIWLLVILGSYFILPWLYALWAAFQQDNRGLADEDAMAVREYKRKLYAGMEAENQRLKIDPKSIRRPELQDQATRYLR